jgi:AcrR family transcriptional regulator
LQRLQLLSYVGAVADVGTASVPGRRDRKKQQTRAALIAAALRLVAERGFDHVTVEDIAEAADVSARTFFNYFASKDEALTGSQFGDDTELHERFLAVPPGVPVIGALRIALAPAIEQMQAEQELWFLRLKVVTENPSLLPRLLARSTVAEQAMMAAIAERTGLGPDSGYPMLVTAVTGAAYRTAMIRWARCAGARPFASFVDEAFDTLATGLADPAHPHTVPALPRKDLP